jgi:tetratricopeptide (TPR) repeat protein
VLERANNHAGLAQVWRGFARAAASQGQYGAAREATERVLAYTSETAWPALSGPTVGLPGALTHGPEPADSALAILDRLLPAAPHPRTLMFRAMLLGMLARFEEAWSVALEAHGRVSERTGDHGGFALAAIALLQGDYESAERHWRPYCEFLREHNQRSLLSTAAPELGRVLCRLGRHEEAEPLAQLGRELGDRHDIPTQMRWRQAQALVLASRGQDAEAERLAREAVEIGDRTDMLNAQGDAYLDRAEVLRRAGRVEDAVAALEQALDRYHRKNNVAKVFQVRAQLGAPRSTAAS